MPNKIVTPSGLKKYQDELDNLKNVKKRELAVAIQEAKEQGDLSENAAYAAAKDEMDHVERRIEELETILKTVEVVSKEKSKGAVIIGSKIKLDLGGEQIDYEIVGSNEADPSKGLISNESAVGEALLGKKEGEQVSVQTPGGEVEYKIISIG